MSTLTSTVIVPAKRASKSSYVLVALVIVQSIVMLGAAIIRHGQTDRRSFEMAEVVTGL